MALNLVAVQSFRGLRKLGLRDQIDQLLRQMAEVILQGRPMSTLRDEKLWPQMLAVLLRIADGWYYFGKEGEANAVVEEARRLLYTGAFTQVLAIPAGRIRLRGHPGSGPGGPGPPGRSKRCSRT